MPSCFIILRVSIVPHDSTNLPLMILFILVFIISILLPVGAIPIKGPLCVPFYSRLVGNFIFFSDYILNSKNTIRECSEKNRGSFFKLL